MTAVARALACTLVLILMFSGLALAQETVELKGLIIARSADTMSVQTQDGTKHIVVLNDDTNVRMPKGLGLRHKQVAWTSLIPGLAVTVKGSTNTQGQTVASQVEFTKESLRMASMIQAGLQPTKSDVEANQKSIAQTRQDVAQNRENILENQKATEANAQQIATNARETSERFASLNDYDVKDEITLYFTPGSSILTARDKNALSQLASGATKLAGYLISVKGFADSSGNAAMNQTLSKRRAEAVVNHLLQNCDIPPRHLLAPGAMGISNPVASNETAEGRANNRRVEVKVMVNKGIGTATGE